MLRNNNTTLKTKLTNNLHQSKYNGITTQSTKMYDFLAAKLSILYMYLNQRMIIISN